MDITDLKTDLKHIHKKWYFKIPIIGKLIKRKCQYKITDKSIDLVNEYITELHKEEFNNKSKEEQFKVVEYVINCIVDDMGLYTKPNWKKICEEVRCELYE